MFLLTRPGARPVVSVLLITAFFSLRAHAQPRGELPSEMPPAFKAHTESFDYVKREEMIPMHDGVRLKTFILIPKGASKAPMLLTRTPYNASERVLRFNSAHLASVVPAMDDTAVAAGYIIVFQDVRGKYGSEGDYVMTRPLKGPLNPTDNDHATDTYETIDWLVRNVPESNGRVGTIGGSYEGYTTVMSTVGAHPALKVAVPFAPMIDGWMGDDWFHNGVASVRLRPGGDPEERCDLVDGCSRHLRGFPACGLGRCAGKGPWSRRARVLARAGSAHCL